jgi:hypothetical protein
MKKVTGFFLVMLAGFSIVSCKKEYTCTCKSVYAGGDYTAVAVARSTKKDAQGWCAAIQSFNAQPGVTTTCSIK